MTLRHAATVGWGALCYIVRPRFIGPQLEHRAEGRHPDEEPRRIYATAVQGEITCPLCAVILDAIADLGIRVKREPLWLIRSKTTKGAGAEYFFTKRSKIRGRKWDRSTIRKGALINGRSVTHHAAKIRAAVFKAD